MKAMASRQQGLTFSGFLMGAILFIFLALVGMKVIPVYMQDRTIKGIFDAIVKDPEMQGGEGKLVRESFAKRAMMNNISVVSPEDINIDKGPRGLMLSVSYKVKVPLVANASLLFEFDTTNSR